MKFDKESIIYIVLIGAAMMYFMQQQPEPQPETTSPAAITETAAQEKAEKTGLTATPEVNKSEEAFSETLESIVLENELTEVTINPNTGTIAAFSLKEHFINSDKQENIVFFKDAEKGALSIDQSDWTLIKPAPQVKATADALSLTRNFTKGKQTFQVTQNWQLEDNYTIDYSASVKNTSDTDLLIPNLLVSAGNIKTLEEMTGSEVRIPSSYIDYRSKATVELVDEKVGDDSLPEASKESATMVSVSNKFFITILETSTPFAAGMIPHGTVTNYGVSGNYGTQIIKPSETKTFDLRFFAGSKELSRLIDFSEQDEELMHFTGIAPDVLSKLLIKALNMVQNFCGNYGIAIIALTILIRCLFWPITAKGTASMKKMQELAPLMKEIKEKYKDNQQLASTKTMELYKTHKVNPVGGCLPMLVQIPIFMAFYSGLDSAVQLRNVSFLWASDLAQPDVIATVMGLPIHPLVLIMAGLMLLQQKMMPSSGDPMQKNMMMMMPVIMIIFMYGMPSGLTLYMTISSVMGILQMLVTRKLGNKPQEAKKA